MCIESVESVEGHHTLSVVTHEGFLLGVDPHVDLQGVGGEKSLAAVVTFVLTVVLVDPNSKYCLICYGWVHFIQLGKSRKEGQPQNLCKTHLRWGGEWSPELNEPFPFIPVKFYLRVSQNQHPVVASVRLLMSL